MASILAAQRTENAIEMLVRQITTRTPNVHFVRFDDPVAYVQSLHGMCTVCGGTGKQLIEGASFGRDDIDTVANFVVEFEESHRHLPAVESPKVPAEQVTWTMSEGRKFRE